jgi:quinate/shikimate dehydrogenase (NAD+)
VISAGASFLCGLIGSGIQGSLSPAMHEQEAAAQGLRCDYRLIDLEVLGVGVEALPGLLADAERQGYTGLNITYPCKQAVLPLLHELSREARDLGAVNTVLLGGGRRVGHNTDATGFAESFRRGLPGARLDRVLLLGAGGAGSAAGHAALALGVRTLLVHDIEAATADRLAGRLQALFPKAGVSAAADVARAMAAVDGLIHCTPTGMQSCPGMPLEAKLIEKRHWVADIVYVPLETELLRVARGKGCRTLDGGGMAVFQAAGAFRLFTGQVADAARMEAHFRKLVASKAVTQ